MIVGLRFDDHSTDTLDHEGGPEKIPGNAYGIAAEEVRLQLPHLSSLTQVLGSARLIPRRQLSAPMRKLRSVRNVLRLIRLHCDWMRGDERLKGSTSSGVLAREKKGGRRTSEALTVATYNVNGINGRLPLLLRWLEERQPDIVCLQELKAPQAKFPEAAIREAGYEAVWHGQSRWNGVAILSRGSAPIETRLGIPGDDADSDSRYIEAAVKGLLIGCLYLPNGNPAPGPKLDRKLDWFARFNTHAADLLATGAPIILAGDYNVMPTDLDVYKPERWVDDALFRPEVRAAFASLVGQGWTDAIRALHPSERIYTFWDYLRNAWGRNAGLRLDHLLLSPSIAHRLVAADVDRQVRGWDHASDHAPVWISLSGEERPAPNEGTTARNARSNHG